MIRKSNFELLRILAMFLIVAHHYSVHGEWNYPPGLEIHKFYVQSLSIGGKIGVNLFVLISSYFLYSRKFKWDGVINIISKTWFYSIFFMLLFFFFDVVKVTPKIFIKSLLPFNYWFVTAFLCMLVLSPFMNIMLSNLDKKSHRMLIIFYSIIVIVPILNATVSSLSFFLYLYTIGAYIRKYLENVIISKKAMLYGIAINIVVILASIAFIDYLSTFTSMIKNPLYFAGVKTPFILCASILVFIYFKQINIGEKRLINNVSKLMFGVYLIHDNILFRQFLWGSLLKNSLYLDSNYIYLHSILSIIMVFIISAMIDFVVNKLFILIRFNVIQDKISSVFNKIIAI